MPDFLSYFRRRRNPGTRRDPAAADEVIDLGSMGGAISVSYVDIASVPAPARAPRKVARMSDHPKAAAEVRRPERPTAETWAPETAQPEACPPETAPEAWDSEASPEVWVSEAPPAELRAPAAGQQIAVHERPQTTRPRRRPEGNGSPPADRKGVLSVHGVEKSFVGRKVVKGVSLYLRQGEAVGLLGPNGAGKTTVFYMMTGLIPADKGRIQLDGYDVTPLPMYQRARLGIGYLPQEASIFRGLSVEQNIRAVLEVVEPNAKQRQRDLDGLLEEFNIAHLRKTPAIALSGGERRRCEIARSLATRPHYMLLDEPFAGIDPIAVGDIQALVRHLTNRGIGVLITDHNVRETLGLTDRAYIIYSGEVLMEGRTDDIVNNPDVRRLYLGEQFEL
ncbi:MAG: LPS export ABC transporter ATP-binding protein [Xanthobacteraceae bacterium]